MSLTGSVRLLYPPGRRWNRDGHADSAENRFFRTQKEARPPRGAGSLAAHPGYRTMGLHGFERMDWGAVLHLGSLLRARRPGPLSSTACRRRVLAAHRRANEHQVLFLHRPCAADAPGRHVPVHGIRADEPAAEKGVLLLAVPRRGDLRAALEGRAQNLRPQPATTALG